MFVQTVTRQEGPSCLCCYAVISALNDSEEHVLTNAVGGRLKVRGLVCRACNDRTGHSWDAELADQLHSLALLIGVDRERGETPAMTVTTTSGEQLRATANGGTSISKPAFTVEETEAGLNLHITARSLTEARRMVRQAHAKYPGFDINATLAKLRMQWSEPQGLIQYRFQIGGAGASRSIVKSAAVYAVHRGLSREAVAPAIAFLRDPYQEPAPLGWYQDADVLVGRSEGVPVNCVGVHANPETGLVLGYVEFFGIHRAVVELGRDYRGEDLRSVYGFDPRSATPLDLAIEMPFDADELRAIFNYERIPPGAMERAVAAVLPNALKRQVLADQERVIGQAVAFGFANCGAQPGDELTDEQTARLPALTTDYLKPWLMLQIARGRRRSR